MTSLVIRFVALAIIDAFAVWFLSRLIGDGVWALALLVAVITLGINFFYLREDLYAFRWFTPGLALMFLLVLYPTFFTLYVAFTNYGDGNLLTKNQAIGVVQQRRYLPEDATTYSWTAFRNEADETILWLEDDAGQVLIARAGEPLTSPDEIDLELGELNSNGVPATIGDYAQLSRIRAATDATLEQTTFGSEPDLIQISGTSAGLFAPRYTYDAAENTFIDNSTGTLYEEVLGRWTNVEDEDDLITPGYYVPIGFDNFVRLFTQQSLRGPFSIIFIWTFIHAFLAMFVPFALGLFLAIVIDSPLVPAAKILRSIILIPYAIPAFITVLVWRGLLQPDFGVLNQIIDFVTFGLIEGPPWRSNPFWARTAIIMMQMWLGFPYMLLICTGALQGIPRDMYEAADVDGAGPLRQFWNLTLPLLLVAVGPLLIASFAFNFNNFTVVQLYLDGGPTIPGATTPAGYTDILITYTYRIAFSSGRGADYGFATAITIVIFILLSIITLFNFQLTRRLEEISENV